MARIEHASVDEYIAAQPPRAQRVLKRVRTVIKNTLPGVVESISYQIPTMKLDGRMVLYFAGFPNHYSIYPVTPALLRELKTELAPLIVSKTIRFSYDESIPVHLISKIAKVRAEESLAAVAKKGKPTSTTKKKSSANKSSANKSSANKSSANKPSAKRAKPAKKAPAKRARKR